MIKKIWVTTATLYGMNETFLAVFEALYFCYLMTCHNMPYIIWKPDALAIMIRYQFGHTHLCLLFVFTFLIFVCFKFFFTRMAIVTKNESEWQDHDTLEKWQSLQFQPVMTSSKKVTFNFSLFKILSPLGKATQLINEKELSSPVAWHDSPCIGLSHNTCHFVTWCSELLRY